MDAWLVTALGLGVGSVIVYLVLVSQANVSADLLTALRLFFAAVLVQAGVKLAYHAITTDDGELVPFKGEDRLYIVIASFVMVWVACADTHREFTTVGPSDD